MVYRGPVPACRGFLFVAGRLPGGSLVEVIALTRDMTVFLTMCIAGHLDPHWLDWFDGMGMRHLPDGNTELSGPVVDQTALYGLLNRARDLGLTLLTASVTTTSDEKPDGH